MQSSLFDTSTDLGEVLKQRGITLALRNANEEHESWGERAFHFLKAFCKDHPRFRAEEAREFAEHNGLEVPKSKRAFGAIVLRAARAGIIKKVGLESVMNPNAHKANAAVWEVII